MKKGIILFRSKYGSAKKYAAWLQEASQFECIELQKADLNLIKEYDIIILGGGIYASGITGLSFFKKHIQSLKHKNLAVFCVGASPYDKNAFSQLCSHNFKDDLADIPCFYCRGAWNEAIMSWKDRTLCRLLQKAVAKQDPATYEPWQKALMCAKGQACDWTDKKYLEPVLEYIRRCNAEPPA